MLIQIRNLQVLKNGAVICSVAELSVEPGGRIAVVGRNGSGKSTLLRVLAGLELDYKGICKIGVGQRDRVYVHQSPYLFRGTVMQNVSYGLRARGIRGAACQKKARDWLEKLGVSALANARVEQLSGGERKRMALARALAIEPRILLLDEPFAEMDEQGVVAVRDILPRLHGTTVIVASPTRLPEELNMKQFDLS